MKRFLAIALAALLSVAAQATTLNPVQLLNPAGSSVGQAPVSTGPTTPPAWGKVPASALAAQAADTVVANATGSSASPTAFAMPSCTGATNALGYTSGTGIVCNGSINAATLGGQTFTSPTITTPNIVGVTNASNATTGSAGECLTASSTATSITTNTPANIVTLPLTAGDWFVTGSIQYQAAATTNTQTVQAGLSTTSATQPSNPLSFFSNATFPVNLLLQTGTPSQRINVSTGTSVFLVGSASFTTSTATMLGRIDACRRR